MPTAQINGIRECMPQADCRPLALADQEAPRAERLMAFGAAHS